MTGAEAIKKGLNKEETLKCINNAIKNTTLYIGLESLEYVVKGGRVSKNKKKIADLFRINPILTFEQSGVKAIGKTFGSKNKIKKFIKFVSSKLPEDNFRIGLAHGNAPKIVNKAQEHFKSLGAKEVISTKLGPALAVHAGPNSLVIAVQKIK